MKTFPAVVLALFLLLPAVAEARSRATLSLGTGAVFLSESHSGGALFEAIRGGYWFGGSKRVDAIGVEGVFLHAPSPSLWMGRVDALYPVAQKPNWKAHLSLGLGALSTEEETSPVLAFGGIWGWQPNTPLSLRVDGRYLRDMWGDNGSGLELGVGIAYEFGYQRKPKPVPPPDGDGDGVKDASDRCPDTPSGMKVDKFGCPIDPPDTDGDGVPDYKDKCPGTPEGTRVGGDGCRPDGDRDGVPDELDDCPVTPPGLQVGADGCVEVK